MVRTQTYEEYFLKGQTLKFLLFPLWFQNYYLSLQTERKGFSLHTNGYYFNEKGEVIVRFKDTQFRKIINNSNKNDNNKETDSHNNIHVADGSFYAIAVGYHDIPE